MTYGACSINKNHGTLLDLLECELDELIFKAHHTGLCYDEIKEILEHRLESLTLQGQTEQWMLKETMQNANKRTD